MSFVPWLVYLNSCHWYMNSKIMIFVKPGDLLGLTKLCWGWNLPQYCRSEVVMIIMNRDNHDNDKIWSWRYHDHKQIWWSLSFIIIIIWQINCSCCPWNCSYSSGMWNPHCGSHHRIIIKYHHHLSSCQPWKIGDIICIVLGVLLLITCHPRLVA